jgi:predicted ArsR family transcriptional regulator
MVIDPPLDRLGASSRSPVSCLSEVSRVNALETLAISDGSKLMAQPDAADVPLASCRSAAQPGPTPESVERVIGALQDPTRRRILLEFYADRRQRTVDEVAAFMGVHRTVAFDHLEQLTRLGLLEKTRRRGRVGKPAGLYQLMTGSLQLQFPPRQFAMLAGLLASTLGDLGSSGREAARQAGRGLGERLATAGAGGVAQALQPLEALGGSYTVADDCITARNCIFAEACQAAPEVICGVHAGLIEGALRRAGIRASVLPSEAESAACRYRLLAG